MYCAYLRKSRADRDAELRGEGETLARHKDMLCALADRLHITISKFYQEVVSGETISARPIMQELLRDVEQELWEGVLVIEVERLARGNTQDQGIVSDAFKYSNTKIITLTKTYDPTNEYDEEYFEFGLFMSRREYKTINRRLQRGRIASVQEGKYVGSTAPFGYERVKIPREKGYTLSIIPHEAEVVQMIFNWYCIGELQEDGTYLPIGTDVIASKLDSLNIKPRVSNHWSKATIADMLKCPTYAGMVRFGYDKETKVVRDSKVVKIRKRDSSCELIQGLHEPIIPMDLFLRAEHIRNANKKNTVVNTLELQNPLSGFVYCAKCKSLMTRLGANKKNKYDTLKCPNKYCDNVSSPMFLVEEQLLKFLYSWIKGYKLKLPQENHSPIDAEIAIRRQQLSTIENESISLQKQLERAYTLLEQGVYTVDVFKQRNTALQADINKLQQSKSTVLRELETLEKVKYSQEQFVPAIEHLLDTYHTNSVKANNQILKEFIDHVDYLKTERNTRGQLLNSNFELTVFPKIPSHSSPIA